jgi:hypothetical protein
MVDLPVISVLSRPRQEYLECEASLGYIEKPYLKKQNRPGAGGSCL